MKQCLILLCLAGIGCCGRLEYLPPNQTPFSKGDTDDLKSPALKPEPVGQFSTPTAFSRQYEQPGQSFVIAGQVSGPSVLNKHYSSQYSAPPGQFYLPPNRISPDSGHNSKFAAPSPTGTASRPNGRFSGVTGQYPAKNVKYSTPAAEFGGPEVYAAPFAPKGPASKNSAPADGQYAGEDKGKRFGLKDQYAGPAASFNKYSSLIGDSQGQNFDQNRKPVSTGAKDRFSEASGQYSGQYTNGPIKQVAILRLDNNPNIGDGAYSYSYETENGIAAQEEGVVNNDNQSAQGGYFYTSPEGEKVSVEYTANADGFQPKGSHIPTPPPVPEAILRSIALNKEAEAHGQYQDGSYEEQSQEQNQYGRQNVQYESSQHNYRGPGSQKVELGASKQRYGVSSAQPNQYSDAFQSEVNNNGPFPALENIQISSAQLEPQYSFGAKQVKAVLGSNQVYNAPTGSQQLSNQNGFRSQLNLGGPNFIPSAAQFKTGGFSGSSLGSESKYGATFAANGQVGTSASREGYQFGAALKKPEENNSQYGVVQDSQGGYKY